MPAGGVPREFHGHANGGCAARRKQHPAEVARSEGREAFGQLHRRLVGKATGAERQLVQLRLDGLDDLRVRIADLMHAVSVEVEILPPRCIGECGSAATDDLHQARCGEGLVEKKCLIPCEGLPRFGGNVLLLPGAAQGRVVKVPLCVVSGHALGQGHPTNFCCRKWVGTWDDNPSAPARFPA